MLSVVIPAYNEAEGIESFHKKLLMPALKSLAMSFEIIYVNDGSSDSTLEQMRSLSRSSENIKVLNLSRNFGKELATTAGIFEAKGDAIILLDADGQHPPKLISDFVKKWGSGAQVVIGLRESNQKEGLIKKWGSKIFYRLFNSASGAKMVPRSTDFRLIDRIVQQEFMKCNERNRITRGLIDWLGFKRDYIEFHSPARLAGDASYDTRKLIKLAMNSFVSLSIKPLEVLAGAGAIITLLALLGGILIVVEQVILGDPLGLHVTGSAMLGVFISFLVGLVIMTQGIIAMYIAHIYEQAQARPLFVVDPSTSINRSADAQ